MALALLAGPTLAEERLDAEGFEALLEGRTLTYGQPDGSVRGIETYYPGRRVTWLFVETDECLEGTWYQAGPADDPQICFAYRDDPASPHCFLYTLDGTVLRSSLVDGSEPEVSYLDRDLDAIGCAWLGV